uniref:Pre-mRNA splicing Prp18-interacting factor n=1 Tax=Tanacetum cinerariifolium TaxID=118510 RepID=A0A699ICW8_TANCI|nr:pre-mRNA splicing Prp18-interacting factor [Tanacetum cinerariifolium]
MSSFVLCVGCGAQLYGFSPCQWCTYERCGNDLPNGFCLLCNSENSCVYNPNPISFDCPPDSYHPPHPTYETYSYDSYGHDSQFGYDCQPQFPLHYECGGPHMNYQFQPMNHDSYNSNSLGFDQPQPPQSPVIHQPPQELSIQEMEDLKQQYLDELQRLSNLEYRDEIKIAELKENFNGMSIKIRQKEKLLQEEQWAYLSTHPSKRLTSFGFDDDDDDEDYTSAIIPDEPVLSTEEPDNSLSIGDEHLDTIPATELDEFIKSGVETLIPIPSESEGIPEHVCDVPFHDNSPPLDASKDQFEDFFESNKEFSSTDDDSFSIDNIDYVEASPPDSELVSSEVMKIVILEVGGIKASNDNPIPFYDPVIPRNPPNLTPSGESDFFLETKSSSTSLNSLLEEANNFDNSLPEFTTFSNDPFDAECESDSSDNQSCSDEDVLVKIVSKHLPEEEIIPMKSLCTQDSSLLISSKIDSLLDEFASELTLLKSILPGIDETDCDFEEDIRLIEKLLYDNSSLRPPKEFVSANFDAAIKYFSPPPILIKDSDSLMEEMDLFCTPDYPMPSGIMDKDYDSKRDILIPKDSPSNNSLSFAEKESFHFDIPLFSRPPAKPPDGDTGILNIK